MINKKTRLTPRALNRDNIRDFSFLVPEDVVADILSDDGTTGFAALSSVKNTPLKYAGALCGCFITRTEYAITSIYVSEESRRQGVGTFLLDTLTDLLDGTDAEISIRVVRDHKEAAGLISFLEKNGFEEFFSESERIYVIDLVNASRVRFPEPLKELSIEPFSRVPKSVLRSFDPDLEEGFVPMPGDGFEGKKIDRELSMAVVSDGKLEGFCVVEDYLEKSPILSAFWMKEQAPASHSMSLISAVRDATVNKYDTDAQLFIPAVNDRMAEMLESIFPQKMLKEGMMRFKKYPDTSHSGERLRP